MCQTRPNLADVSNVNRSPYLGTFRAMTTNRFHDNLHKQTKDCHAETRISWAILIHLT